MSLILLAVVLKITLKAIADPLALLLFKNQEENTFKAFFNVVPENYMNRFKIIELDKVDDYSLKYIEDELSSGTAHYIILEDEGSQNVYFLQAYHPLGQESELDWQTHVAELVDLKVFNRYLAAKGINQVEQVYEMFFKMLARPYDSTSFKVVHNMDDVNKLLVERSPTSLEMLSGLGYNIIDVSNLDIPPNEDYVYCWIYNKGLVRFKFIFDGKYLVNVESEIIGFLGNEIPMS